MALSAVSIVLGKLADSTMKKALELYDVTDRVDPMKTELNLITGFLKDADAKSNRNPLVKAWVNELRDLAYRIEDALDTFLVDIEENKPTSSSVMGKLKRAVKNPIKVNDLRGEIIKITELLKLLYGRATQMGIRDIKEENHPIPTQLKPAKPSHIDDSEVVGLNTEKDQIISHLLDRTISRRTVLSIVGTGGLGKTTLANKVYSSIQLEGKFNCRAWLSISQKFDCKNILRQLLYSVDPKKKQQSPPVTDEDLPEELNSSLTSKRYLIILDDVWTVDLWEQLKTVLPDPNNASRVLITTRKFDVATAADCNTKQFKLRYLNDYESLDLLFRNALQQKIQPDEYRPDLKKVAEGLIKKCDGLPLALKVLGGILSTRACNSTAWEEVEKTLDWHNKDGEKCSKILALSYEDLPYELKPCFLYFASFPEDYEISAKHITKMWVAEGFIPKVGAGTMEDRAKDCLAELVQRCLVHVNKIATSGRCKTCRIHDLLRDVAINEAKEGNFFTVFSKAENGGQLEVSTVTRRAALHFCTSSEYKLLSSKIRTLTCFGKHMLNYQEFRLLRVLSISNNGNKEDIRVRTHAKNEGWLNCLTHLRYLGIRSCHDYFGFWSVSFSHLKNLETLDITDTTIYLPIGNMDVQNDSLWEVPTMRNVISSRPILGPSKWDNLRNIQTLKWVKLKKVPVLANNTSLRKIGVQIEHDCFLWKDAVTHAKKGRHVKGSSLNNPLLADSMIQAKNVWHILKDLFKCAESLTSLYVRAYAPQDEPLFGTYGTSNLPCHKKLRKLHLHGRWSIALNVEMLPTNLVKLTLRASMLYEDPMPILELLQCLRVLKLLKWSYAGSKLTCSTQGFPSLQKLMLKELMKLSQWDIKMGAMPILNHLTIKNCVKLHTLPELQNVPHLQEVLVDHPSAELNTRMLQTEEHYKIKHIPSVRILNPRK